MKRLSAALIGLLLVSTAVLLSRRPTPADTAPAPSPAGLRLAQQARNPWNRLKLNSDSSVFPFAVLTARTGGPRRRYW